MKRIIALLVLLGLALPAAADLYTMADNTIYHVHLDTGQTEAVVSYPLPGPLPESDYFSCATVDPNGTLLIAGETQKYDESPFLGVYAVNPSDWSLTQVHTFDGDPWGQLVYKGTELFMFEQYSGLYGNLPVWVDMYPVGETFGKLFPDTWFVACDGTLLYLFAWDGSAWHNYSVVIGDADPNIIPHYPGHVVELSQTPEALVHFGPACFQQGTLYRYGWDGSGNAWLYQIDLPSGTATVASPPFWAPAIAMWFQPKE